MKSIFSPLVRNTYDSPEWKDAMTKPATMAIDDAAYHWAVGRRLGKDMQPNAGMPQPDDSELTGKTADDDTDEESVGEETIARMALLMRRFTNGDLVKVLDQYSKFRESYTSDPDDEAEDEEEDTSTKNNRSKSYERNNTAMDAAARRSFINSALDKQVARHEAFNSRWGNASRIRVDNHGTVEERTTYGEDAGFESRWPNASKIRKL